MHAEAERDRFKRSCDESQLKCSQLSDSLYQGSTERDHHISKIGDLRAQLEQAEFVSVQQNRAIECHIAIQSAHLLDMQRFHQQNQEELLNQANEHAILIQQMHDAAAGHTTLQRECEEHIQRCHTLEMARDADFAVSDKMRVQLVAAMDELSKSRTQCQVIW